MKLNEKRIVEYVLLVLFPAALFAGCAGNGNEKPQIVSDTLVNGTQVNEMQYEQVSYTVEKLSENETVIIEAKVENESVQITDVDSDAILMPQISIQDEQVVSLEQTVYFGSDKYTVGTEVESLLAQYASKLLSEPSAYLVINGHADERGTEDYNLSLSELRAREVEGRLLSLGVPENQLRIHSYGESIPAESSSDWQENRRVELEYTSVIVSNKTPNEKSKQGSMISQVQ